MLFKTIFTGILFFLLAPLMAQTVTINNDGKPILYYNDGSWKYYEPSDSIYLPSGITLDELKEEHNRLNKIEVPATGIEEYRQEDTDVTDTTKVEFVDEYQYEKPKEINDYVSSVLRIEKDDFMYVDPILVAPRKDCAYTFKGFDESIKKDKVDLAKELILTHTDDRFKSYVKDDELFKVYGNLASLEGGFRYLKIEIHILSRSAIQEYGSLNPGSSIEINLINGDHIRMLNEANGEILKNDQTGAFVYKGLYLMSYRDEKKLRKSEVDSIRLTWSRGYESYEVQNVDFFKRQFYCLNQ